MTERRASLRLKKNLESTVYVDGHEYAATIIDISNEGVAFKITPEANLRIGDKIRITVHEEYKYMFKPKRYTDHVTGYIRNLSDYEGEIRCGCLVRDPAYREYVAEQFIMIACNSFREDAV